MPEAADIDGLEQAIAGRSCIGGLSRWERHYQYAVSRNWPYLEDTGHIHFVFYQAGVGGFVAGRRIDSQGYVLLYDGPAEIADGLYDVRTGAVTVEYCGSNFPAAPPGPTDDNQVTGPSNSR
jgi:hypothetical protein